MPKPDKLSENDITRVAELVRKRGQGGAVEALAISRESLARVLARLPVRRGTVALVRQGLATLALGEQDRAA